MRPVRGLSGQLVAPLAVLMMLFAAFLAGFLGWCRAVYWQMRLDMVAEAVALSAARAQAGMLNTLATLQTSENVFMQKAGFKSVQMAHMQIQWKQNFDLSNQALSAFLRGFNGQTGFIAQSVARANRIPYAIPSPKPDHHLRGVPVYVIYFADLVPVGYQEYEKAYFVRQWGSGRAAPQPDHETSWGVSKFGLAGTATARLWLDVDPNNPLTNGGFPGLDMPWWRDLGIQCFYPQFNARLVPTPRWRDRLLKTALRNL